MKPPPKLCLKRTSSGFVTVPLVEGEQVVKKYDARSIDQR